VLKVGNWYLMARCTAGAEPLGQVRTYNVARLLAVRILDEGFERPRGFDLAAAWEQGQSGYADRVYVHWVDVRLTPRGLDLLPLIGTHPAKRARELASAPDAAGRVITRLPLESARHAEHALLRLGAELEVLGPPELRERLADQARALAGLYADPSTPDPSTPDPLTEGA
jgi:predicted DNA-binding transcriptional regulator YafY